MLKDLIIKEIENSRENISIILKDLTNDKWIFKQNENRVLPSASLIKIPIMIEGFNRIEKGDFKSDENIKVKEKEKIEYSLVSDLSISSYALIDLITLMIILSDNTATNVLIDLLGMENINSAIKKLGCKDTILNRKMLDFEAAKKGKDNFTSPMDMGNIMEKIYNRTILSFDICNNMINILEKQKFRDMIPRFISEDIKIAHKTGELKGLNHDIGIFSTNNKDYLLGVFTTDGENDYDGKETIGKIGKIIFDYLSKD